MSTLDRLVTAAAELFYEEGIHRSTVDSVVERSGLSKPTLYKYFGSKRDLVGAVLELRARNRRVALEELAASQPDPAEALGVVVTYFVDWYAEDDYRGCALVNGAVELPDPSHPARAAVRRHKLWMTDFVHGLAEAAALHEPREFAESFVLLEEGATVLAYINETGTVATQFRRAVEQLTASHQPPH